MTDPRVNAVLLSPAGAAVVRSDATVALDGSWRSQLIIPVVSPGRYTVIASCVDAVAGTAYTLYRPEAWQVTADLTVPP